MQDKFTRQAANALKLAKTTAQSCNHSYIGTEHILVGLLKEKEGTAGRILEEFNVEEDALRQLIEELIHRQRCWLRKRHRNTAQER